MNFRYSGEFEKQEAVMLCWINDRYAMAGYDVQKVFCEVIANLTDHVQVHVNCGVTGSLESCKRTLKNFGVDIDKIHFTQFADTLNWARDYGADILVDGKGNKRLVNMNFNTYGMETPEGKEASMSVKVAPHQAIELGCTDIVNSKLISEGGDKEFNGDGILITIEDTEVRKRNPEYTREEVETEFKRLFNLKKVIWLPSPSFEDEEFYDGVLDVVNGENIYRSCSANGHIDEMCRFIDNNTILLAEISDDEAAGLESARITKERLDQAYKILSKAVNGEGNPFKIVRIPCPVPIYLTAKKGDAIFHIWQYYKDVENIGDTLRDGTPFPKDKIPMVPAMSYCNFLISNSVVLGQKYWRESFSEEIKAKDKKAEAILKKLFPGRKVVMIETTALNILGGGIHCITKNIPSAVSES